MNETLTDYLLISLALDFFSLRLCVFASLRLCVFAFLPNPSP